VDVNRPLTHSDRYIAITGKDNQVFQESHPPAPKPENKPVSLTLRLSTLKILKPKVHSDARFTSKVPKNDFTMPSLRGDASLGKRERDAPVNSACPKLFGPEKLKPSRFKTEPAKPDKAPRLRPSKHPSSHQEPSSFSRILLFPGGTKKITSKFPVLRKSLQHIPPASSLLPQGSRQELGFNDSIFSATKLIDYVEKMVVPERRDAFNYFLDGAFRKMHSEELVQLLSSEERLGVDDYGTLFRIVRSGGFEVRLFRLIGDFCDTHSLDAADLLLAAKVA
jgi:hypothetical protein